MKRPQTIIPHNPSNTVQSGNMTSLAALWTLSLLSCYISFSSYSLGLKKETEENG